MKHIYSFLIFSTVFFSCKNEQPVLVKDNVLDIAISREPKMLHPFVNPVSSSRPVNQNIFLPLADFHPETYELTPILIDKIPEETPISEGEFAGGVAYTIQIRQEAKWDNGSPITAKDLLFSLKAIMHPDANTGNYKGYISRIGDAVINEDNTNEITIYFKDYYILSQELVSTMEIYPQYHYDPTYALDSVTFSQLNSEDAKKVVEENISLKNWATEFNSVKFGRESVNGAGPYKVKEWVANQRIVLEKKKNYWGENLDNIFLKAYPEEIVFHVIPDATTALIQLKEKNIDMITKVSADDFFGLQENETYKDEFDFLTVELMKYYYIALNNSQPELSDPDVRRALAHLIDIKQLIEVIEGGLGAQTVGAFNNKKEYYNKSLSPIAYDIEKAKSILSKEGWEDSNANGTIDKILNGKLTEMELEMYITGSDLSQNIALLFQKGAKQAGINIKIITKKYSDFRRENLKKRDYDLTTLVIGQDLVLDDPYNTWHSDNDNPSKSNDVSYRSKKADQLIDKIRITRDKQTRNNYYMELQEVMYEDQPVIFLYNPMDKFILSKTWKGQATLKRPGYIPYTFSN